LEEILLQVPDLECRLYLQWIAKDKKLNIPLCLENIGLKNDRKSKNDNVKNSDREYSTAARWKV